MTSPTKVHSQLDRARFQSKVIEANLEHLGLILSTADAGLRDELASFTRRFGLYVGKLDEALTSADAEHHVTRTRRHGGAAVADRK
jgi:hypothetical protein